MPQRKLDPVVTESWLRRHIKELPHRKFGDGTGRAGRVGFTDADLNNIFDRYAVVGNEPVAPRPTPLTRRRAS